MPIIKSAKKKLRQDKKRTKRNTLVKNNIRKAVTEAKNKKTAAAVRKAISVLGKAAKKGIIHKNKASRLTSALSKLVKESKKTTKPASKTKKTKTGKVKSKSA